MPIEVRTISDTTLVTIASFVNANRNQGDPITFTLFSGSDSAMLRAVPYGVVFLGACLSSIPRSFPFVTFQRYEVWQGGASGLTFNPGTYVGYYALLFQPNENAVGQNWTFVLSPD